jgi:centrosomal protein CEP78
LDISGIALRETALKILAKGLFNNSKIKHLSLSKCKIGDSGIFILAPSIRTIKHLRVLNLSDCSLTERGAHIISAFLKVEWFGLFRRVWQ